jgi:hypothetical protein
VLRSASRSTVRLGASLGLALACLFAADARAQAPAVRPAAAPAPADESVYLVYFWRARPGKQAEYARYIREVAEPIDEAARQLGAFEEVKTYTPFLASGAPSGDWTHMRVFRLKNFAAVDSFSVRLDAATKRLYPDERSRPTSAEMRDLVRQEIWRGFR